MIIQGIDSSSISRPLLVDASGRAIISAVDLTTTGGKIAIDASGNVQVEEQLHLLIPPVPRIVTFSNTSLPAGASSQTIATVTASETWEINTIFTRYDGTVAGVVLIPSVISGGSQVSLKEHRAITSTFGYFWDGSIILSAGDTVIVAIQGATLNDDLYAQVAARRIY